MLFRKVVVLSVQVAGAEPILFKIALINLAKQRDSIARSVLNFA